MTHDTMSIICDTIEIELEKKKAEVSAFQDLNDITVEN